MSEPTSGELKAGVDLTAVTVSGTYSKGSIRLPQMSYPSKGTRYYKTSGYCRLRGEWLMVQTGDYGLAHWDYMYPIKVAAINYPNGKRITP